jgi:hypothetical protein
MNGRGGELGQLSLADGLGESGAGRNGSWRRSRRWVERAAFERLLGRLYPAPARQRFLA